MAAHSTDPSDDEFNDIISVLHKDSPANGTSTQSNLRRPPTLDANAMLQPSRAAGTERTNPGNPGIWRDRYLEMKKEVDKMQKVTEKKVNLAEEAIRRCAALEKEKSELVKEIATERKEIEDLRRDNYRFLKDLREKDDEIKRLNSQIEQAKERRPAGLSETVARHPERKQAAASFNGGHSSSFKSNSRQQSDLKPNESHSSNISISNLHHLQREEGTSNGRVSGSRDANRVTVKEERKPSFSGSTTTSLHQLKSEEEYHNTTDSTVFPSSSSYSANGFNAKVETYPDDEDIIDYEQGEDDIEIDSNVLRNMDCYYTSDRFEKPKKSRGNKATDSEEEDSGEGDPEYTPGRPGKPGRPRGRPRKKSKLSSSRVSSSLEKKTRTSREADTSYGDVGPPVISCEAVMPITQGQGEDSSGDPLAPLTSNQKLLMSETQCYVNEVESTWWYTNRAADFALFVTRNVKPGNKVIGLVDNEYQYNSQLMEMVFLALSVGPTGYVVVMTDRTDLKERVSNRHPNLIASHRVIVVHEPDVERRRDGYRPKSPYNSAFIPTKTAIDKTDLKEQLSVGAFVLVFKGNRFFRKNSKKGIVELKQNTYQSP